jgi:hypothetical protein
MECFHILSVEKIFTCGGKRSNVHSIQAVTPGIITRALPLNAANH